MLHVVNGEATVEALRVAGIRGDGLVWRDALLEGPAPNALRSPEDWETRGARVAADWGFSRTAYLQGVEGFFRLLDTTDEDEVVLWFEEDLFCQLPLSLLVSRPRKGIARWSVVCPEWPLALRSSDELRKLHETRADASERQALAARVWEAYGAPSPDALVACLELDFHEWPLLRRGVIAHLARFPSVADGLNVIEQALLHELRDGPRPFVEVFRRWNEGPLQPVYGLGDHQVALALHELASCLDPLVRVEAAAMSPDVGERLAPASLALTRVGEAVLAGSRDHWRLNQPDRWLGGVHLRPGAPTWRWDAAHSLLVKE